MRRLTILFFTSLLVLPLFGQSSDRIELSQDIEYYRNSQEDIPFPDVYMPVEYPPLISQAMNRPEPVLQSFSLTPDRGMDGESSPSPELQEEGVTQQSAPVITLAVPGIPHYAGDQKLSDVSISASRDAGMKMALHHHLDEIPSTIFVTSGYQWGQDSLRWISGGGTYEDHLLLHLKGGYGFQGTDRLYGLFRVDKDISGEKFLFPQNLSLFVQQIPSDAPVVWPGFRTGMLFAESPWHPAIALEGESLFSSSGEDFRLRPSVGVSREGVLSDGREWQAEAEMLLQYETEEQSLSLFSEAFFSLVTPGDHSFFITIDREELNRDKRMQLGLLDERSAGLLQFTGWQDGAAGLTGETSLWDYYVKTGLKWGEFLWEDDDRYSVVSHQVLYGDLQFRYEKHPLPVTDLSFHAEYINSQDLQYRMENVWFFAENLWSAGFKIGHYHPEDESLSTLVRNEKFLYGLFAVWNGKDNKQIRAFLNYTPEAELLDGGVSFRFSY